ncbi:MULTISPECIES: hypothetical protein [Paenibacillus]|uniref:hypothetical protein n=1 Tax=Paenibacillus TaxID=44249 RepID=UPI0009A7453F|nr:MULTISPECIES: hypothetical protein [Paenibacillus]MCZ1268434.1 hypothetical protein [Paenibacillus tundrae]SLK15992.1 hypothetical protein SAMN06272722_11049 [Paenibacillus sp. RU5A]SOC74154.1 hypothetical protein SAMN05880581_11049 [Paenibacillus sp. RU26A]SOC76304.1 hypothetical protein SAMN05880586_11049 [Paenibacillus sp. RU5M]
MKKPIAESYVVLKVNAKRWEEQFKLPSIAGFCFLKTNGYFRAYLLENVSVHEKTNKQINRKAEVDLTIALQVISEENLAAGKTRHMNPNNEYQIIELIAAIKKEISSSNLFETDFELVF